MTHRIVFAFLLLAISSEVAVAQKPGSIPYGGTEVFRFALYKKDLKPITDPKVALRNPRQNMIVILGDRSALPFRLTDGNLLEFVQGGGSVLIASDSPGQTIFGTAHTGRHLTAAPQNCYRGIQGRPFVSPGKRTWPSPSPFDLFAGFDENGVNAVATDHPSEMGFRPRFAFRISIIAAYPAGTVLMDNRNRVPPTENHFAIGLETFERRGLGPGRVLILADHSVFVNGMLGFREDEKEADGFTFDNANWKFANRTIDWLKEGAHEPRTGCLFIEDGRVVEKFAIEIPRNPTPPIPDIPPEVLANWLLNNSNSIINEAQKQNFFNRLLQDWVGLPRLIRYFLIAVTVLFLFNALRWLIRGHRKKETSSTLTPEVQARLLPRGGVLRQRTAAQLDVGNLSEAAGRRVRERFDVLGGEPGPSGNMPPIFTATDVRDSQVLVQAISWLWSVGYGDAPVSVPPSEWDRFNSMLERITLRASRGDWSFGQDVA